MLRYLMIALLCATALWVGGCQSNGTSGSQTAMRSPDSAVYCDACKTTWVRRPTINDKGRSVPFQFHAKKTAICPECQAAADQAMDTGTSTKCKSCGGTLQVMEPAKM